MHLELSHLIHLYAVLAVTGFIYGSKDDFVKALYNANISFSSQAILFKSIKGHKHYNEFLKTLMENPSLTSKVSGVLGKIKWDVGEVPKFNDLNDIKKVLPAEEIKAHKKLDNLINICEKSDDSVNRISANFKVLALYIGFISFCFLLLASICNDGLLICSSCGKATTTEFPVYLGAFFIYDVSLFIVILVFIVGLFFNRYFFSAGTISIVFILTTIIAGIILWKGISIMTPPAYIDFLKLVSVILIISPWMLIAVIMAIRNAWLKITTLFDKYILLDVIKDFNEKHKL